MGDLDAQAATIGDAERRRCFRFEACASSSATSSGLNTTGKRSGVEIRAIRSPKPGRPSVTWKKTEGPRRPGRGGARAAGRHVKLVATQILRLGKGRPAVDERRKHTHLPDVVAFRLLAETADGHVLEHPLAKRADGSL